MQNIYYRMAVVYNICVLLLAEKLYDSEVLLSFWRRVAGGLLGLAYI